VRKHGAAFDAASWRPSVASAGARAARRDQQSKHSTERNQHRRSHTALRWVNDIWNSGKLMLLSRIEKLQRDLDLRTDLALQLECRVNTQQQSIRELEGSVAELSLEGELLQEEQLELRSEMEREGSRMRAELVCQQRELDEHRIELDTSKGVIQKLQSLCMGQDFVVDSAILLSSMWLSSFQLFQMPLVLIARLAPKSIRGGRAALLQILRLLVTLLLARHTRKFAVKYRLHSTLGSMNLYGRFVKEYLHDKISPQPTEDKEEHNNSSE